MSLKFQGVSHNKVNLFFNYYKDENRQREIDKCLRINKKVFDRVILIERLTFQEMVELTKEYPNDVNVFCNSDIYFTDLTKIKEIKQNECFALCRHDLKPGGKLVFFNRSDSQDAWVFRGQVKEIKARFTAGKWGCDNHLAWLIKNAGYDLKNPSLSIKIVHIHEADRRTHMRTEENTIKPPYLLVMPTL